MYDRIKSLREQRGLTQQELANKVGFKTASAINKIELGLRDINQTKIIRFAEALNTTPSYLMGWEDESQQKKPPEIGELSAFEQKFIEVYRSVPENRKPEVEAVLTSILGLSAARGSDQNGESSK